LTGNSKSGKTTLAKKLIGKNCIHLDGDILRNIWKDIDLSEEGRREQGLRTARLAKELENQGYTVIVSVIAPYESLRKEIQTITDCKFIYIEGGKTGKDYPYEIPQNPVLKINQQNF